MSESFPGKTTWNTYIQGGTLIPCPSVPQLVCNSSSPYRFRVFQGMGKTCCTFIIVCNGKPSSLALHKHWGCSSDLTLLLQVSAFSL